MGSISRFSRLARTSGYLSSGLPSASMGPAKNRTFASSPLRRAAMRAASIATGSRSNPTALFAPSATAASASTPLPVPTSSTRPKAPAALVGSDKSSIHSRQRRVEACSPVPNACPGSITISRWPGSSTTSIKGGRTRSRCEIRSASRPSFHASLQSTSGRDWADSTSVELAAASQTTARMASIRFELA